MPQDSLRSVVYRSFVTCDDPEGVVECGMIRKSKSGSQRMEHKIESRRRQKNWDTSLIYNAEKEEMVLKGIDEEFQSPSSFQLMEVSRGAQKLNQMTDSWSKGQSFDYQNKDIAKNLLKGALDLQESLIMLGKLQEASHFMAQLKRKQEKSERGRIAEMGIERTNSHQLRDQNYPIGFQKPRLSADGSSRNCFDELKKVIRVSLASQNLLPNTCTEENACFLRRNLDSVTDIPSASSSESLKVHTDKFSCTDSSLSSKAPKKSAKGSNLIAKLMGLEEISSKPLQATPQKQLKSERIPNQRKPIFDIDMPKVRKTQVSVQKLDPERRTLKEVLETMQFKGLLKSNSGKMLKSQAHHSHDFHSEERFNGYFPPIVLIKPLPDQFLESEEHLAPIYQEKEVLNTKKMLRKVKIKESLPPKTVDSEEGALNLKKMPSKLEVEETVSKRFSHEGAKDCKEILQKPDEKVFKTREKASTKTASAPKNHKPQRKEEIDKKANKIQKATNRKPAEKETVTSKNVSISQGQAKVATTKLRKPNNGSNINKNQIPQKRTTSPKIISKHTTQTEILNSGDLKRSRIKKEKPVVVAAAAKFVNENLRCKEDDERIDVTSENNSVLIRPNIALAEQLHTEEETDASEFQIKDHRQSSVCDVTVLSSKYKKRDTKSTEEARDSGEADSKCFKTENNLKSLILTCSSFPSHEDELFDLNASCPIILKTSGCKDSSVTNATLSLDCATELIKRRSLPDSKTTYPLSLACAGNLRIHISRDQLVDEVCHGIECLKSYSLLGGENLPLDILYGMLERDLKCKGMVSGIWDLGWKNGFSMDEAEQVVNEIEKLVLNGLIEEVLT